MAKALTLDEAKDKIFTLTKQLFKLNQNKKMEMKDIRDQDTELKDAIEDAVEAKEAKTMPEAEAKSKVFESTKQRGELAKQKRALSKEFKDDIDDVTKEILAVIAEQEKQNTPGTSV